MHRYRTSIYVPLAFDKIIIAPLLLLRRIWYGYSFRQIPLANSRRYAIVEAEDYYRLSKNIWWKRKRNETYYVVRFTEEGFCSRAILMHRQILEPPRDRNVDHINRNGFDNRRANLRLATKRQNIMNRRFKKGTSKYKGVCFRRDINRWVGQMCVNYKKMHLGVFEDEIEAARAYDEAAKKHFGEFAFLNFPPEQKVKGLKPRIARIIASVKMRNQCKAA